MSNMLTRMVDEILSIAKDIPLRLKQNRKYSSSLDDFEFYTFEQTWATTNIFYGIGGDGMTVARTYVFVPKTREDDCFVYFAGRFAYQVPYSDKFMEDVIQQWVEPATKSSKYLAEVR